MRRASIYVLGAEVEAEAERVRAIIAALKESGRRDHA